MWSVQRVRHLHEGVREPKIVLDQHLNTSVWYQYNRMASTIDALSFNRKCRHCSESLSGASISSTLLLCELLVVLFFVLLEYSFSFLRTALSFHHAHQLKDGMPCIRHVSVVCVKDQQS